MQAFGQLPPANNPIPFVSDVLPHIFVGSWALMYWRITALTLRDLMKIRHAWTVSAAAFLIVAALDSVAVFVSGNGAVCFLAHFGACIALLILSFFLAQVGLVIETLDRIFRRH